MSRNSFIDPTSGMQTAAGYSIQPAATASPTFTGTVTTAAIICSGITNSGTDQAATVTSTGALNAGTNKFIVSSAGLCTEYNGISTVSNGLSSVVATVDLTAQVAAKTITTVYTPTATGLYKFSLHIQWTTATTSGVVGPVTITYTDGDNSVAQSVVMAMQSTTGTTVTATTLFTTVSQINGELTIYAKTGIAIQYAIAQSGTIGSGQWAAHGKLEAL
jgi:hypothetical protein